jgi:hypothetical protein
VAAAGRVTFGRVAWFMGYPECEGGVLRASIVRKKGARLTLPEICMRVYVCGFVDGSREVRELNRFVGILNNCIVLFNEICPVGV